MSVQRAFFQVARLRAIVFTLMAALALASAPAALAGKPTSTTLNPQPPDFYTCKAVGGGTICRASTIDSYEFEPTGISCGSGADAFEVLDSGTRHVNAVRYYDRDGNMTRRIRTLLFQGGHLTNPLNGTTIGYAQHNTDVDAFGVPGDQDTVSFTGHGVLSITVPGRGAVILEAGISRYGPMGDLDFQAGPADLSAYFAGDDAIVDDLCVALMDG